MLIGGGGGGGGVYADDYTCKWEFLFYFSTSYVRPKYHQHSDSFPYLWPDLSVNGTGM